MGRWKKFMAAVMALSMTTASCMPQTLWAAEFSVENGNEFVESFEDGAANAESPDENIAVGEENADAMNESSANGNDVAGSDPEDGEETGEISFGTGDPEDEEKTGEISFGTGDPEITDGMEKTEETRNGEDVPIYSPETADAGQAAEGYVMQLYSNGKLEKTYVIPYAEAEKAQAPAALTGKKGYIFKEWNTKENGKGASYKPGASIKELLRKNDEDLKSQNAESAILNNDTKTEVVSEQEIDAPEVVSEQEMNATETAVQSADASEGINLKNLDDPGYGTGNISEADTAGYAGTDTGLNDNSNTNLKTDSDSDSDMNVEEELTVEAAGENENNAVTLYAIWEKAVSYKITYKLNKGKNNAANPKTYTSEDKITLKNPTRSGYHFAGWYRDSKYKKKISVIEKGSKGTVTLYAKWVAQVNPSAKAATLTSVRGIKAKTLAATVTIPKYVKSCDEYYYLVYVDSNTGKVKKEAAKLKKPEAVNQKITFKLDISGHPEYAQGKFAVAVKKSKSVWSVISGKSYVSSPEKLSANKAAYFVPKTKKGIQSTDISEVTETKSKTAFINIYASDILSGGYGEAYVYNGKKYYFGGMYGLRYFVQQCNAKGVQVTAQISLDKSSGTQSLTTGNSPYAETAFYGWNTAKSAPRQKMEAMFAYLGELFGSNDCYVSNWILGNEINSASHYYYVGNVSFNKYISMYSEAFRCLYNAVRSSRGSSRVFICLDNCWNQKNIFTVCYTSKSTLDTFASTVSGLQKGINWNLAYHAYSQPLTESQFWSSVNAPLLSNDGNTATFITMHNIQALTNYVKNRFGSKTRVILSEQGFSSSFGGQANQAASMALAYYKAACNPMIDAFIIRSYQDEAHEVAQGLALGLKAANGKKKTVYNVFRNMDASNSLKYTGKVLNSQVGNWKAQVPGYTAKRVSGMYRK